MEALRAQIGVLTDEMNLLKAEIVQAKANHASLHQSSVEANTATARSFAEIRARADVFEGKIDNLKEEAKTYGGSGKKPLIEPKQVEVAVFAGAMTDGRARFLEWCEKV